jgi:hypothetical protein
LVLSYSLPELSAQRTPDENLFVNGKSTSAVVLQVGGHSYIEIETLAQITNGSVKFEPNQIVLIIPNSNFDANYPQASSPACTSLLMGGQSGLWSRIASTGTVATQRVLDL